MRKLFLTVLLILPALVALAGFDASAQASAIAGALKNYYSLVGSLELTPTTALATLDKTPTSVELLDVPAVLSGLVSLKVRFVAGHETISELSAPFKVRQMISVYVPRRQLSKDSALSSADFEVQSVDRFGVKLSPVDTSTVLSDYELTNTLPAGTPLTWNYLRNIPLVRKGALVDVVAEDGALKITSRAVATHNAGRGQSVQMRNTSSNRPFEATVVDENTVKIHF